MCTRSCRCLRPVQVQRGVDNTHMAESLWKIAKHATLMRVVLLGKQADIIA